jgi:hypothetical protein
VICARQPAAVELETPAQEGTTLPFGGNEPTEPLADTWQISELQLNSAGRGHAAGSRLRSDASPGINSCKPVSRSERAGDRQFRASVRLDCHDFSTCAERQIGARLWSGSAERCVL